MARDGTTSAHAGTQTHAEAGASVKRGVEGDRESDRLARSVLQYSIDLAKAVLNIAILQYIHALILQYCNRARSKKAASEDQHRAPPDNHSPQCCAFASTALSVVVAIRFVAGWCLRRFGAVVTRPTHVATSQRSSAVFGTGGHGG